jgi:hypothetical protein
MTTPEDIDELVAAVSRDGGSDAFEALIRALDTSEVYYRGSVVSSNGGQRVTTPLLRLEDGSHALVVHTSKSHPGLPEKFGGAPWRHVLEMAATMPHADWLIVTNARGDWLPIRRAQAKAIRDGLAANRPSEVPQPNVAYAKLNADLENLISRAVHEPTASWAESILSHLQGRELFIRIAPEPSEAGRPVMITSEVGDVRGLVQAYTTRSRSEIVYGGMMWEAIANMIKNSSDIPGVRIINDADDWVVLAERHLGD